MSLAASASSHSLKVAIFGSARRRLRAEDPVGLRQAQRLRKGTHEPAVDQVPGRERRAGERDTLAVDRGVDRHAGAVQDGSVRDLCIGDARRLQPARPVRPAVDVDQRKLENIGRLAQPSSPGQQLWTAHREQLLRAELDRVEARPVAVAMADREIDFLARKIDMMQRCRNAQVDAGVRFGKMPEPVHQPFGGEVRRRADRQNTGILPLEQPFGAERDPVERIADDGQIVAARLGDDKALAFAVEQLDAKLGFERLDLMADRALRDVKLVGRARETLMPGGGLEGLQGIERWQARAHRTDFMRKTRAG